MKLESGKTYLNRKGERVTVVMSKGPDYAYEFKGSDYEFKGSDGQDYTSEGAFWADGQYSQLDLIAEAPEVDPNPPNEIPTRTERKIVQLAPADRVIYALCNDGTLWLYAADAYWLKIEEIPQP